ncbi:MAG: hypothetical protein Q4A66_11160, partial [Eubacteriales bacterium]|nr:hypothetical protein [Eubacteriales bacterium]
MDYRLLHEKTVAQLRALAKEEQIRIPAGANKARIVELLLEVENKRAGELAARQAQAQHSAEQKLQQKKQTETSAPAVKAKRGRPRKNERADRAAQPSENKAQTDEKPAQLSGKLGQSPEPPARLVTEPQAGEKPARSVDESQVSEKAEQPANDTQERKKIAQAVKPQAQPVGEPQAGEKMPPWAARPVQNAERPAYPRTEQPRFVRRSYVPQDPAQVTREVSDLLAAGDCATGGGVLEPMPEGYGFLRAENYQQGTKDVYVSAAQIRRFNLRAGDLVTGRTRPQREGDRYNAILYIDRINGEPPEKAMRRPRFEDLTPVYPQERIRLENPQGKSDMALRVIDMLAPIGRGQRALIVSQPKAGKTVL